MNNHEEPEDWDPDREETPPENLKRKWIEREYFGKETQRCPTCGKYVPAESLTCMFCGGGVTHDTGLLGRIIGWLKSILK